MARKRTHYTNRWLLRRTAVLFGIAVLFFCLSTSSLIASLLQNSFWLPLAIDQGWATLFGAAIGLSIVGWQTKAGFSNLRKSQANQANLDRQARTHQAELDREARQHQFSLERQREKTAENHQKKALAAAINGELLAAHAFLVRRAQIFKYQAMIYKMMPADTKSPSSTINLTGAKTDIFDRNVGELGALGASICGDVVEIFQSLKASTEFPANTLTAGLLATIYEGMAEGWLETHQDVLHLQKRLIAVQTDGADPGAVFYARQARKKD